MLRNMSKITIGYTDIYHAYTQMCECSRYVGVAMIYMGVAAMIYVGVAMISSTESLLTWH